jgi:hypothetical protein
MSTNNPANALSTTEVIDAMRSIQNESDRWRLAEALAAQIPAGSATDEFKQIVDDATAAGVVGGLSVTTLRLYRDTANRWPADKRIPNVSFSAHREAMPLENVDAAAKILSDLVKTFGADKVTVAAVRRAVAVAKNRPLPVAKTAEATTAAKVDRTTAQVLADIAAGAPQLIASIDGSADLDRLHAGLNKALAHVEKLRTKAAQKAKRPAAKAPARKPAPKTTTARRTSTATKTAARKPAARKPAGDLRGL